MGRIYTVANQKGGVGKTTTAINLASYLAIEGKMTLFIDIDPQGNGTSGLGMSRRGLEAGIYEALINHIPLEELISPTAVERLDMVPSNLELMGAEVELMGMDSRESLLRRALEKIKDRYDYIIIDSPPSLGLLTVNTLVASDQVIIPIQCEYYALEGLSQLLRAIELIQRELNPSLKIGGVLLTMADPRTNLSHQVIEEVRAFFKDLTFKTIIPRSVRLSEAPGFGKPILLYDGRSKGAEAYQELAKEVMLSG